jgi:hypothetical protein
VGIATSYGLDWTGRQSNFSAPAMIGPGAHPASYTMGTMSIPGVQRLEHGINHSPPSSAKVKEREELYLQIPSVALQNVTG